MVNADDPALTVKLGAFEVVPPVVPNTTVAVAAIFLVNPPVPVQVKFVAVAILSMVVAAVVLVNAIFADPKVMARVIELSELKIPVLSVLPFKLSVPSVSVNVLVAPNVSASARVKVAPTPLTATLPSVLPAEVSVPDVMNVGLKPV